MVLLPHSNVVLLVSVLNNRSKFQLQTLFFLRRRRLLGAFTQLCQERAVHTVAAVAASQRISRSVGKGAGRPGGDVIGRAPEFILLPL